MTERLLLDEHYSLDIAASLTAKGFDIAAVVGIPELRGASDDVVYSYAKNAGRRVVTENIKDFRPILLADNDIANSGRILLVPPRRFPRGVCNRNSEIANVLEQWLDAETDRSSEEWLT
jgi:predicted nuclease of predicted toxin-antitoxin system